MKKAGIAFHFFFRFNFFIFSFYCSCDRSWSSCCSFLFCLFLSHEILNAISIRQPCSGGNDTAHENDDATSELSAVSVYTEDMLIRGGVPAETGASAAAPAATTAAAAAPAAPAPVSWAWPGAAPRGGAAVGSMAIAKGLPLPPATPGSGAGSGADSSADFGGSAFARQGNSGDRRPKGGAAVAIAAGAGNSSARGDGGGGASGSEWEYRAAGRAGGGQGGNSSGGELGSDRFVEGRDGAEAYRDDGSALDFGDGDGGGARSSGGISSRGQKNSVPPRPVRR